MPVESGVSVISGYDVQDTSEVAFTVETAHRLRIDQASCRNYGPVDSVLTVWLVQATQGEAALTTATVTTLVAGQEISIAALIGRSLVTSGTIRLQSSVSGSLSVSITGTNYI